MKNAQEDDQSKEKNKLCNDAMLEQLTKGELPEESDFNTAAIASGCLSPAERRELQDDLLIAEQGSTRRISREEEDELYDFDDQYFWNLPDQED